MFNLSRYFSSISLALIVLAGGLLGFFYYQLSVAQLVYMAQERNVAMAHAFRNTLWPRHSHFVEKVPTGDGSALRAMPQVRKLHEDVLQLMRGTEVVKAKIYNLTGLTVYSSDASQIGEMQRSNHGFQSALGGVTLSEQTHRNHFDSFEGKLSDRDVISSYIPVRNETGRVLAVFELYQDVTPFLAHLRQTLWWIALGVSAIFGLLYLAQYAVVRHAQAILRCQEAALQDANRLLDARVEERTQALATVNERLMAEVQERMAAEERLDLRTHYDPLTGLPNWFHFNTHLRGRLAHAQRHGGRIAVLMVDLDNFRAVNDSLGHSVGDALLKAVSSRLNRSLRREDTLARMSGDEFICTAEGLRAPLDAANVARQLLSNFSRPFHVDGHELSITACIGVSVFPEDGLTPEVLVRNADTAVYRAKERGHNSSEFYTPEMTVAAADHLRMHRLLGGAIKGGELALAYQPQVDVGSGQLVGAEALLRWHSPDLGQVPPAQFIPLAEDTGLIVPLGEWVLEQACRQLAQWDAQGLHLPVLSVNLSVRQLAGTDVPAFVSAVLQQHGLEAGRLELEITESTLMNAGRGHGVLQQLHDLGVGLSVDDFGTGYSSLAYIKALPIDKLKIDRAFVVGIGQGGGDEAIVNTIIAMARALNLNVIAEGVETQDQAAFLLQAGCFCMQGYRFGRPEAPEQFALRLG